VTLIVTDNDGSAASTSAAKTVLDRPPVASFTSSPSAPYTSDTVTFNASASYDPDGTVASYFWTFGDGTNGTGIVVTHSYVENGNYTVTLKATDNDGSTALINATKTVLDRPPVASFTASATAVDKGQPVTFNASSSYDPDGTVVSYFWTFGDGTNATGQVVSHSYANVGSYTVTLTVTDNDNSTSSTSLVITVGNKPPVASFTSSPLSPYTTDTVAFNASTSYDLDGNIVSYFWAFGDGTNATGVVTSHAYVENGTYTVTLTVTDNDGATGSTSAAKTILNRSPVASFASSPSTPYTGDIVTFNASASYDLDGSIVSYFWNFGDGTNATGMVTAHAYAENGNYVATLTITDNDGSTASTSATKTVLDRSPVASFTSSPSAPYTSDAVTFNASASYDPDGTIASYFWTFGDGTNGTGMVVTHSYVENGNYTVTLTVTDNDGSTASTSATKAVLNRPPVASFTSSPSTPYTSETATFNSSASYDPDGTIVSYSWNFGDGTNAIGMIATHTYAENGTYTVTLTVTDNDGSTASTSATKTVLNRPPVASFTSSPSAPYTSDAVTFNASASYDSDGTIVSYFWTFGDGTNGTGMVVTHSYVENGNYTVTLRATDNDGATASINATKTILDRLPVASFTASATAVDKGQPVTFNASTSYDPDGTIASYFWSFGDETNATGQVVSHSYGYVGSYTVTLTVTDNDNSTSSTYLVVTVGNKPPLASFTVSASTVYTNVSVTFNASASYDPDGTIASYFWSFGDGTNATGMVATHAYVNNGLYSATLEVTDNDGAVNTTARSITVLNRPPVASFTVSSSSVSTGTSVYFNASASYDPDGSIVGYSWNFGDGSNGTGVTVSHSYVENGTYLVTLTISDDDGSASSANATETVIDRPPVASFTDSASTVLTNVTIYFNASASYDPDGSIVSYFWAFGDGTNATGFTSSHAYAENGTYTVTLTVTDNDGSTASTNATKTVLDRPPIANFTESADTVYTGDTISFNASSSYDVDGAIVSYFWTFGDGVNASGVVTSHSYVENGNYTVTLIVTDNDGITATASALKKVVDRPPNATFGYSPTSPLAGETVTFNASASFDPDGTIAQYIWDFGDGNVTSATTSIITHKYTYGNYTATLTVEDNDGSRTTTTKNIAVRGYPIATFTFTPSTPTKNQNVTFDASESDPRGDVIVSYFWDFGDGNKANTTGKIVIHTYVAIGNYTAGLTVTTSRGLSNNASKTVTVTEGYPIASFTFTPTVPATGQIVSFNASASYDPDGAIVNYVWNFGDGNVTSTTNPLIYHSYATIGNYTVGLTVTDNEGLTATTTKLIAITSAPRANFNYSPEHPYLGDVVTFDASSSTGGNRTIVSYTWNFGDGTPQMNKTNPTTTHVYTNSGNFTIALTVTDDGGLTSTTTKTITVLQAPVAVFTYSPVSPEAFDTITYNASGSYDPNGYVASYVWNFGDGNVTTVTTPTITHYYTQSGNYTVVLIVSDNSGYTDSTSKTITVLPHPPTADFTYSPNFPIIGEIVTFNASRSYDLDGIINSYTWNFGDGNTTNTTNQTTTHTYTNYGNYTVTLTVTDSQGLSNNKTSIVGIRDYPTANFTMSPTIALVNSPATFNASLSTPNGGVIVYCFWDFGDGAKLNTTNPISTHVYAAIGNYTVTLTVGDSEGLNGTTLKTVQVGQKPTANFTYSPGNPYVGDTLTFNASSSYDTDGFVVSYMWDFGDGSPILNTTNPVIIHVFSIGGNNTVALTVVDNLGFSDTKPVSISVNKAPVADFTYSPGSPIAGATATFNASLSYDARRSIANYTWDFGDGNVTTTTNQIVMHAFSNEGNYSVRLTVLDTGGYNDTRIRTIVIRNYPIADFAISPAYPIKNEAATFNASSTNPRGGTITNYSWDFGDGTKLNTTTPITNHVYLTVGQYNSTLIVTDSEGLTNTISKIIKVRDYPTADFTWSPIQPIATEAIIFNASASRPNSGTIANYTWSFGDGNVTTTSNPLIYHSYTHRANYTVTLTVMNSEGLTTSTAKNIVVLDAPPISNFSINPQAQVMNQPLSFNASASYDPDGSIVNYTWNFGDGNTTTVVGTVITHAYVATGKYTVTLTVTDDQGLNGTISKAVEISLAPVVNFTYAPTEIFVGNMTTFNASASYDPDGSIANYTWNFGDGNTTTTTNPIVYHTYAAGGDYQTGLTVCDNKGLTSTISTTIHVKGYPIPRFMWTPPFPIAGETTTFDASLSSSNGGTIVNYTWNFGDGTQLNTTSPTATHVYNNTYGDFTVTLGIINSDGLSNFTSKVVRIRGIPVASFDYSPKPAQRRIPMIFDATSSNPKGGMIINYTWNFGDGNSTTTTNPTITHFFQDGGIYQVNLTIFDSESLSSYLVKQVAVYKAYPVASFTQTPEKPVTSETATFNASQSYDPDGSIINYTWNFGDGNTTTTIMSIIYHAYTNAGTFNVTLTLIDNDGYATSTSHLIQVIARPLPNFAWSPQPPIFYQSVTFNASSSSAGSGSIINYTWNFGDGSTTTTTNPITTHVFNETGFRNVTLTLVNSEGLANSTSKWVGIYGTPSVNFTWTPTTPSANESVSFDSSASQPNGGYIVSYVWDFGDGTTPSSTPYQTITHRFVTAGTYSVTLNVTNSGGVVGTTSKSIVVRGLPRAEFTWSPQNPYTYDRIVFDASSSSPGTGTITSYAWNFGDGNITTTTNPTITHSYNATGNYIVALNITNSDGLFNATTKTMSVAPATSPIAEFTYWPTSPGVYGQIAFNASNTTARGGSILSYTWNFGDGNSTIVTTPIIYHAYQAGGNYTVMLNVTTSAGYWGVVTKQLVVVPISGPTANFTLSPSSCYPHQVVVFNATDSKPGWNGTTYPPIASYEWNFGDGNVTAVSTPTIYHAFALQGNYTVTLKVTDSAGRWSTKQLVTSILSPVPPTASFTCYPVIPHPNQTATFDASSSTLGWNGTHHPSIQTYVWNFGDGNTTTTTSPVVTHSYVAEGNYNVALTVVDINGLNGTMTKIVKVAIHTLPEDVNGDGIVNMLDTYLVALHYGETPSSPNWIPAMDVDRNGIVNMLDLYDVSLHYGETAPT